MTTAIWVLGGLALQLGSLDAPAPKPRQYVAYAAEQQVVAAGKQTMLELRFHVADGYHVNSHKPVSELQIATTVDVGTAPGVKVAAADYPAGKAYRFSFDPSEKLDVYSEDFVVKLPIVAVAGAHELKGALKYQACDRAACYPPKTLPLDILFTAK
jgi:hypothetical protein